MIVQSGLETMWDRRFPALPSEGGPPAGFRFVSSADQSSMRTCLMAAQELPAVVLPTRT